MKFGLFFVAVLATCAQSIDLGINPVPTPERAKPAVPYTGPAKPNVIIFIVDDMGYGDLYVAGNPVQEFTPIDQLAQEGTRFTQWYSGDSLCTPARAALQTGHMPARNGVTGGSRVYNSFDVFGLPLAETTLADMFKSAGYRTGMSGKWHLGINHASSEDCTFCPSNQGYDYVGWLIPISHQENCDDGTLPLKNDSSTKNCLLYYGKKLMQQPYKVKQLVDRIDASWNEFITTKDSKPFFFYYAFPQVHAFPWSTDKAPPSKRGKFGDLVNEMGWALGKAVKQLDTLGIRNNTLVIFTGDHGAHRELCQAGGKTAELRGSKAQSWEGGLRVNGIANWPGVIKPNQASSAVFAHVDMLPTLATLAGATLDPLLFLDGISQPEVLLGQKLTDDDDSITTRRPLFWYCMRNFMAVRYKHYKAHYAISKAWAAKKCINTNADFIEWAGTVGCQDKYTIQLNPPILYNLNEDQYEQFPMDPVKNAALLAEIQGVVDAHKKTMDFTKIFQTMGTFDKSLDPCCNPPTCGCDDDFPNTKIPKLDAKWLGPGNVTM